MVEVELAFDSPAPLPGMVLQRTLCLRAWQALHALRRVVAAQRRQIHASNRARQPCCLPVPSSRSAESQWSLPCAIPTADVFDPNLLDPSRAPVESFADSAPNALRPVCSVTGRHTPSIACPLGATAALSSAFFNNSSFTAIRNPTPYTKTIRPADSRQAATSAVQVYTRPLLKVLTTYLLPPSASQLRDCSRARCKPVVLAFVTGSAH